jgi:ureidoglycolate amidohydrolase
MLQTTRTCASPQQHALIEEADNAGMCLQAILRGTRVKDGDIAAFVELHIEQGPLLEREGFQLGIVSAIAAPAALRVFFSGDGGHAGALLMPDR